MRDMPRPSAPRMLHVFFLVVITGASISTLAQAVESDSPSPHFEGTAIPLPPAQTTPWEAPTIEAQYEPFVSATERLFAAGMADPRGCEYRQVSFATGSCWTGDAGVFETNAWVLPSADEHGQRFAVTWNGLVYPLVSMGEEADLDADIAALLAQITEIQAQENPPPWRSPMLIFSQNGDNEQYTCTPTTPDLNKACLLFRLGKGEAAKAVFDLYAWQDETPIFEQLADNWTWSHYNRALCAQMRGDDHLAFADYQLLVQVVPGIRERIRQESPDSKEPPLRALSQLEALYADMARRLDEAPAPTSEPDTITAMIADLENVDARQMGQPGGIPLGQDPRVKELIALGESAIEPLLECLENDRRFTRSVKFWRDFSDSRTAIGVHEAAYVALATILNTSFMDIRTTSDSLTLRGDEGRAAIAAQIRAYWDRYKSYPPEERWYLILQDDNAEGRWLEAAHNIARPVSVEQIQGSQIDGFTQVIDKNGDRTCQGEALRRYASPSVSELMLLRLHQMQDRSLRERISMAIALTRWDVAAGQDDIAALYEELSTRIANAPGHDDQPISLFSYLTKERLDASDTQALSRLAELLATLQRDKLESWAGGDLIKLMAKHSQTPQMQAVAPTLFGPGATLVPLFRLKDRGPDGECMRYWRYLVHFPDFKQALLENLSDTTVIGTIERRGDRVYLQAGESSNSMLPSSTANAIEPGTPLPLRMADLTAERMNTRRLKNDQLRFRMDVPQPDRDQVLARLREYVESLPPQ